MLYSTPPHLRICARLNAAFKKGPVNQLLCLEGDLHALGRNGVLALCNLRPNGEIAVISARPLCPWIKGFTPCGFDEERELIFGFRGKTFMVVSYSDHQILDSFDCGGPNRQWYFTTHLPVRDLPYSSYYFFDFLSKGKIITAHLHAKVMTILALPANTARIIGATNINTHEVYSTLATIGADHSVTIFRIYGASQERDLNLVLYNEAMPTSVCSTVVLTGEYLIFVGGEKGSITTWLINPVDLITLDPRHVISNEYKRGDSSARVTSVSAGRNASRKDLPDLEHFVAAAYADGVIEILKVVFANDKLGVSLELFRRIDRNPDFSVPTKIDIYRRRSPDIAPVSELEVHAVSTSGKRAFHYTLSWDHPEIRRRMANDYFRVEKCGLSALYVAKAITTRSEGDMLIIGSESGRITVIYSPVEGLPKRYAIGKYHSATVTGLFAFHSEGNSYVGSVALDCRFALWEYNGSKPKGMELIKAIALDVRDPSELVLVNFGALIVGDGMQFIDLEPYLLLGKTSSSRSSF
ncbi:hypothetical protein Y032_0173g419 [Ancylostoma ceylanicum]|nr:hypothetical protein Y032_0173g419 [Ancylostoma ceylanicum]